MTISVTIPLQHNGMVETSAIPAAMQNLYNAAMEAGFGPGAAITGRAENRVLTLTMEQPEPIDGAPVVTAPRRGRPPKSAG